ncbi:MAG: hypothetical protein PHI66_04250 [Candidatus Pacebacteria bacterium]|nr:hypothetical protein [Candidatus Paceibacterota bacterium]
MEDKAKNKIKVSRIIKIVYLALTVLLFVFSLYLYFYSKSMEEKSGQGSQVEDSVSTPDEEAV